MTEDPRRRSFLPRIVIAVAILSILGYAVLTSGILPRDWRTLRISAQGPDTLVALDARTALLKNMPWPGEPIVYTIQVAGWTGSAGSPDPTRNIGAPGYVEVNYNGTGANDVIIGTETITFVDRGESILINGKPTPLSQGSPLVVVAASRPAAR